MTYLGFLLTFILPPLLLLLAAALRKPLPDVLRRRAGWSMLAIVVIAFVYTTPWDNYLVREGIWYYGPDRVLGTIGYVPYEEYMFFILQPVLAGLWLFVLLQRPPQVTWKPAPAARIAGAAGFIGLSILGFVLFTIPGGEYMGLILGWACPIVAGMWAWKGDVFWNLRSLLLKAFLPPTVYLWVVDRVAIVSQEIWTINPSTSLGWNPFGLPIEEAVFFLVTTLLSIKGLFLLLNIWKLIPDAPTTR